MASKAAIKVGTTSVGSGLLAAAMVLVPRLPPPAEGWVRFRTVGSPFKAVELEMTAPADPSTPSGVTVIARPGQVGRPVFTGRDPTSLKFELVLDGIEHRASVQAQHDLLERLAGYDCIPPALVVEGVGVPHAFNVEPRYRWQISEPPEFSERLVEQGRMLRFACTVTVMRLDGVSDDALAAATERSYHVVRSHGLRTLQAIASHYRTTWTRLRSLNPKLPADPDAELKAGIRVVLS